MTRPVTILFVCTANIARSPYAELTSRSRFGLDAGSPAFESAGTQALPDHQMDEEMALLAEYHGASTDSFRSSPLTAAVLDHTDLILTMQSSHREVILNRWPQHALRAFTLGHFASLVEAAPPTLRHDQLLEWVRRNRGVTRADLDILDPYGRGPDVAAHCAGRIDTLLDIALPRLL